MYTPPVTPRKLATPEVGDLTFSKLEVRSEKCEFKLVLRVKDKEKKKAREDPRDPKGRQEKSHLESRTSNFEKDGAAEGGASDWGEVVTR